MAESLGVKAQPLTTALVAAAAARRSLRAVGACNAMAARAAADAGADALWVSGLEVSASLGVPDENVLSPGDLAGVVAALDRAARLPIIVDVDNAGGAQSSACRFAGDLARAGASALCLEDSAYPKCNSFALHRSQGLADLDLVCSQLQTMRCSAGPNVLLIARTEALICGRSLSAAFERAYAYVEAGAGAVLVHSKDPTGGQALMTGSQWRGSVPLVTVPTAFPHLTVEQLGKAGFALAIYANQLSRVALIAMQTALATFAATGSFNDTAMASVQDLLQITDPSARADI